MAARTRTTTKAAAKVVSVTQEKLTAFDSHGARYFRLALPREPFAPYESPLNAWEVTVMDDGSFAATPVRELVEITPKVPKGAKKSAA
jgi:hypothetical protein